MKDLSETKEQYRSRLRVDLGAAVSEMEEAVRFPTILGAECNRILPHLPVYKFLGYWQNWRRILMMEDGYYLGVEITPLNPAWDNSWDEMLRSGPRLFWTQRGAASTNTLVKDHFARKIDGWLLQRMYSKLGPKYADYLLTGKIWAEVEKVWPKDPMRVHAWLRECGENGGVPLKYLTKVEQTQTLKG